MELFQCADGLNEKTGSGFGCVHITEICGAHRQTIKQSLKQKNKFIRFQFYLCVIQMNRSFHLIESSVATCSLSESAFNI
jgi:hypothetical protein